MCPDTGSGKLSDHGNCTGSGGQYDRDRTGIIGVGGFGLFCLDKCRFIPGVRIADIADINCEQLGRLECDFTTRSPPPIGENSSSDRVSMSCTLPHYPRSMRNRPLRPPAPASMSSAKNPLPSPGGSRCNLCGRPRRRGAGRHRFHDALQRAVHPGEAHLRGRTAGPPAARALREQCQGPSGRTLVLGSLAGRRDPHRTRRAVFRHLRIPAGSQTLRWAGHTCRATGEEDKWLAVIQYGDRLPGTFYHGFDKPEIVERTWGALQLALDVVAHARAEDT